MDYWMMGEVADDRRGRDEKEQRKKQKDVWHERGMKQDKENYYRKCGCDAKFCKTVFASMIFQK